MRAGCVKHENHIGTIQAMRQNTNAYSTIHIGTIHTVCIGSINKHTPGAYHSHRAARAAKPSKATGDIQVNTPPSEADPGSTKASQVTLPAAKASSTIVKVAQEKSTDAMDASVGRGMSGMDGIWTASDLDALDTEGLAAINMARMNDGSYMTVTMLEDGGINMRPYNPGTAIQVRGGPPGGDPRLPTPMDELGDEMIKELRINARAS